MKNILEILKFIALAALVIVGYGFLMSYQTKIRNEAIDGCAKNSTYQNQFTDEQGRLVTNSEPQKTLYTKCLSDKGIVLNSGK